MTIILCRGNRVDSDRFYSELMRRFDCKDPKFLVPGDSLTFTGVDISMYEEGDECYYRMDQERDMMQFLERKGLAWQMRLLGLVLCQIGVSC